MDVAVQKAQGIEGELWMVHSGGFYDVQKTLVAPKVMPKKLHWFKWVAAEACDYDAVCLSGDLLGEDLVERLVKTWLTTDFETNSRHSRRVDKIMQYEKSHIAG